MKEVELVTLAIYSASFVHLYLIVNSYHSHEKIPVLMHERRSVQDYLQQHVYM